MRIAFYAPLKSPDHPTPSGDRRMARLLIAALEAGGHKVGLASEFRSFEGKGDAAIQAALSDAGEVEAERLIDVYLNAPFGQRPEAWFSYHLYYKAPDHLGPSVARALNIPYIVSEPSYAPKRAGGSWALGHELTGRALARADAVLCLTKLDMACVVPCLSEPGKLFYLPPFLNDRSNFQAADIKQIKSDITVNFDIETNQKLLVGIGMMRAGDKLESFRRLAGAMKKLEGSDWTLMLIGDGEARADVEAAFIDLNNARIRFVGALKPDELERILPAFDLCLWPAAGEAYGMALLEAQAAGIPVVAGNVRGVPEVVLDGETAVLVPENDAEAFAGAVRDLLDDDEKRLRMAARASDWVRSERSVENAAKTLSLALTAAFESDAGQGRAKS